MHGELFLSGVKYFLKVGVIPCPKVNKEYSSSDGQQARSNDSTPP